MGGAGSTFENVVGFSEYGPYIDLIMQTLDTGGARHSPEPFHSVTVEFEKPGAISEEISRFEYEARFVLLFLVCFTVGGVRFFLGFVVSVVRLRNDFRRSRFAESRKS